MRKPGRCSQPNPAIPFPFSKIRGRGWKYRGTSTTNNTNTNVPHVRLPKHQSGLRPIAANLFIAVLNLASRKGRILDYSRGWIEDLIVAFDRGGGGHSLVGSATLAKRGDVAGGWW